MATIELDLHDDVIALLQASRRPAADAAREIIVMELFRRAEISAGRAAEILDVDLLTFLRLASSLGIPVIDLTEEEWEAEGRLMESLRTASAPSPTPAR